MCSRLSPSLCRCRCCLPLSPPPRPLLSKARGEPRFSPPSGRAGKGAALPVTWRPGPLALIGSSSRQAARHTRPARPRREGQAQPLRPARRAVAPSVRSAPALDAL
jgi:hypothetical protein